MRERAMAGRGGRRRGGKKGRRKGKEFMDAALDAYIRHQALRLWRGLEEALGDGVQHAQALRELGEFSNRGAYEAIWRSHWSASDLASPPLAGEPDGWLVEHIEAAVRASVLEERALRQERGDRLLEDLPDYNAFVQTALSMLLEEASGEIEDI